MQIYFADIFCIRNNKMVVAFRLNDEQAGIAYTKCDIQKVNYKCTIKFRMKHCHMTPYEYDYIALLE